MTALVDYKQVVTAQKRRAFSSFDRLRLLGLQGWRNLPFPQGFTIIQKLSFPPRTEYGMNFSVTPDRKHWIPDQVRNDKICKPFSEAELANARLILIAVP
jgi:hypothetical protein